MAVAPGTWRNCHTCCAQIATARAISVDNLDSELQLDADSTERISHRIASGVYRIFHNKRDIGEELWGIFALKDGGMRLLTEIALDWPVPNQQRARFDLNADWTPRVLWLQLDVNGTRRVATYTPEEAVFGISVYEQSLRGTEHSAATAHDRTTDGFRQSHPPRQTLSTTLPRSLASYLDFGSTLFNFAHLKLIALPLGASIGITAVVATQPALTPIQIKQTYTFTREEQISNSITGYGAARRYVITEDGERAPISTLWTDNRGIALRQEILMGNETHGCELVSYTWDDSDIDGRT
jgi:hypothetical protein